MRVEAQLPTYKCSRQSWGRRCFAASDRRRWTQRRWSPGGTQMDVASLKAC